MSELALASTAADAGAVERIEQDAAEFAGALDARVSAVLEAARSGNGVDERRADLLAWCETRLLTQIKAEESALYPAGTSIPEARLLVEAMRAEHDVVARLVAALRTAALPSTAAATAASLQTIVESHLAKVTNQLVPALAVAPEVALAELLNGMRDILGVEATHPAPETAGHGHDGRPVDLHPDRGGGVVDVAEQRPEEQHGSEPNTLCPMSTPVKRPDATPAVPAAPATPLEPVQVVRPFGWILIVAAGVGVVLATWLLYGTEAHGMWAGYRDGFTATVVLVCAMALNSTLPKRPFLGVVALAGILLILFAVFLDNSTQVFVTELVGGAAMLAGAILYGAGDR